MALESLPWTAYALLGAASLSAGFVDAAAGGGGLIQLPALFMVFPHQPFAYLSGTNKCASSTGTLTALSHFKRSIEFPAGLGRLLVPPMFLGAVLGAHFVSNIEQRYIKPLVVLALVVVWLITALRRPQTTTESEPTSLALGGHPAHQMLVTFAIGFYDGLIGPGTGTFLIAAMVFLGGSTFLAASGFSKLLNLTSNIASILYFVWQGTVLGLPLLAMVPAQIIGGWLGAGSAVKFGSRFVRIVSLWVTAVLIGKLVLDLLAAGHH